MTFDYQKDRAEAYRIAAERQRESDRRAAARKIRWENKLKEQENKLKEQEYKCNNPECGCHTWNVPDVIDSVAGRPVGLWGSWHKKAKAVVQPVEVPKLIEKE